MSRSWLLSVALVCFALGVPSTAQAHEMRPSLLELRPGGNEEQGDKGAKGTIEVHFKVAYARGKVMPLAARLPEHCKPVGAPLGYDAPPLRILRWTVDCGARGLAGRIAVDGLSDTGTDVILRIGAETFVLRPSAPFVDYAPSEHAEGGGAGSAFVSYVALGVMHIWAGPDHLLFVLGLLLLVGWRRRQLLITVTAFTIAHSLTLALASLGIFVLPSQAVEAVIALSIVVLAVDVLRAGPPQQRPGLFAFVCGLLHGFGFAGVLSEVGLPESDLVSALLGFNLGVELGQLAFIVLLVALGWLAMTVRLAPLRKVLVYAMGSVGAFWFWERVVLILDPWVG